MREHIVLLFVKLNHAIDLYWELFYENPGKSNHLIFILKFLNEICNPGTLYAQIEVTGNTVPSLDVV
jgi:hypothetical protein